MYIYWEEHNFKTCPLTKEICKGPQCLAGWRWTKEFNGDIVKDMPHEGFDLKILPHMIGFCGVGEVPKDRSLEPWNRSRSEGHFRPYNP